MDPYTELHKRMTDALGDLAILAGDTVGPSDASWQDVAGTAAVNLRSLASLLDSLREGATHHCGRPIVGPIVFPSPREALEG